MDNAANDYGSMVGRRPPRPLWARR
jgi:hypothetical protein